MWLQTRLILPSKGILKEEIEDIKGVIRIRKSKDRQHKSPDHLFVFY